MLKGQAFRLLFIPEILENESGGFAGLSTDRIFIFMTVENGRYVGYGIREKDVSREHVRAFTKAPASSEDKPQEKVRPEQLLRVGLRLNEKNELEIYDLSRR